MEMLWTSQGFRARPELSRTQRSLSRAQPSTFLFHTFGRSHPMDSNGSCGARVMHKKIDPKLGGETLALGSAIRAARIEIGIQLKKIRNRRARIHGNWGSQSLTIESAQDRLFGGPTRDRRGGAEPSPAELPSELRRVSEPARSEDLEDFNRNPLDFPRISSSAGAGPS